MKSFDNLTSQEVRELIEQLNSIDEYRKKLDFIYANTGYYGLGTILNKDSLKWGVTPESTEQVNELGQFLMQKKEEDLIDKLTTNLKNRLTKCESDLQKTELLNHELKKIPEETKNPKVKRGFEDAMSKEEIKRFLAVSVIKDAQSYGKGAALYKYSLYVKELIDDVSTPESQPDNLVQLNDISERLLYLKYSGLYKHIEVLCDGNKTRIACYISHLTGMSANSIRPLLSYLEDKEVKKNSPYKKNTVENTIRALSECKLETKKLEDVYEKILSQR